MLVCIKSHRRNKVLFIEVEPQDTALNLKEKISEKWDAPVALQEIIVGKEVLKDTQPLDHLILQHAEAIWLIERIPDHSPEEQDDQTPTMTFRI